MSEHRPSSHKASDLDQIVIARELFNWWWQCGTPQLPAQPDWANCKEHIQAFWMEGAWRVMSLAIHPADCAASDALGDISKLVGAPDWEYPGQVVRDVAKVLGISLEEMGEIIK